MSYAVEVKKELANIKVDNCCALSELSALLKINGNLSISSEGVRIDFQTTNPFIARRLVTLIKQLYKIELNLLAKKRMKLDKGNIYIVRIKQMVSTIIKELFLMDDDGIVTGVPDLLLLKPCDIKSYLRGAFLASGSVNNPQTSSYHLEISSPYEEHANGMMDLINQYDIRAKVIQRKKGYIVYVKEAEKIGDFLRVIGANNSVFAFEDSRIRRDLNNSINRVINMEIANMNKTLEAAKRQLRDVKFIEHTVGLDKLTPKLQEAALLRKENPESSLLELSSISEYRFRNKISKSGLNHRFRNIKEFVENIKKSKD